MARGFAVNVAGSDCSLNPIHGADLAVYCVNKLTETGQWQVGGPEVLTNTEIINQAALALGKTPIKVVLPHIILKASSWVAHRVNPRAGNLIDFFTDMLTHDSIGEKTGTHTVSDYFATLTEKA